MTAWIERFLMDNPMLMEQVVSAVALVALGLWTRYKMSERRERLREGRFGKALAAIDAAVEETGREYVRELKAAASDGKLTRKEMDKARTKAASLARQFALKQGISLAAELGRDFIAMYIARSVETQKGLRRLGRGK